MRMGARGWGGVAIAALLCVAFAHFCVRIVPGDEGGSGPAPVDGGALPIPVEGVPVTALVDTFARGRAAGARRHDAIDIMAARGRAVLAVVDGRVEKLFWSHAGGRTLYLRSRDGRTLYYYAHLDRYADGLREGQGVRRGQRIATVGSTGNADPAAPHLHFAVHAMQPGEPWYGGRAVNPYPLLRAANLAGPLPFLPSRCKGRASLLHKRRGSFHHRHTGRPSHEDQRRGHSSRQQYRI